MNDLVRSVGCVLPGSRRTMRFALLGVCSLSLVIDAAVAGSGGWVQFSDETAARLVADPSVGVSDPNEKDYAWGDVDQDGDIDMICTRKEPFTTPGRRTNVLFMNENGVLVDRTAQYAVDSDIPGDQGFLTPTNDRDQLLVDLNGDGWLDIVTATTISEGQPKHISHPRIYVNKGEVAGVWQGFRYEDARIPQIFTITSPHAVAPRFCSVAAGDVDNDGDLDLYFGDYDSAGAGGSSPENAADDVNDRLFINNGLGFFTDSLETRMNASMLLSAFSMAAAIVDMNGDGVVDVVKDSALNVPQRVSISYNNLANPGFFNGFEAVYNNSPYHITVGELNNDGRPDMIVTDDGPDQYMLNVGNGADGFADFQTQPFSFLDGGSDDGFGGDNFIADLNNDGFNDVIITDADVDIPGCSRRMHIYRNLGNVPSVTLQEQGGAAPWTPNGVHDLALFDINGDGWTDMVIGTCTGTQVWINIPPVNLQFAYPDGIPGQVTPNQTTSFRVTVTGAGSQPQPGTGKQFVSVDGGPFVQSSMSEQSANVYFANLPATPCTSTIRFYFTVDVVGGGTFSDPSGAPGSTYSALSSLGQVVVLDDKFETDVPGWAVTNDVSLTAGAWTRVDPVGTFFPTGSSTPAQPENDFGQAADQLFCYVTQQSNDAVASNDDVDGGPTILNSPVIDLEGTDAYISYARWAFWSAAGVQDFLATEVTNNGTTWVTVSSTSSTGGDWEPQSFRVSDYVQPSANVRVRFVANDTPNDSVLEAAIDNFLVTRLVCPASCGIAEDCDDGLFCNGAEVCNAGTCGPGVSPCPNLCDETADACVDCFGNSDCDDGLFCNGAETCNAGSCQAGTDPCAALGLTCDENIDACTGCVTNANCDDGLFCNGSEVCAGGVCTAGGGGVVNGTFDGATGWTDHIPVDGTITYAGTLSVVGPDGGDGGFTWSSQANVNVNGGSLSFTLVSYASGDSGTFDYPVFHVDGTFYGLDADGTLGPVTTGDQAGAGTISNASPASNVNFTIALDTIAGPGLHTIGLGVCSVDGIAGAGTAVFDNVLPAVTSSNPCPGQLCDESTDACVECLTDNDCADSFFCNGVEVCSGGTCQPGSDPCAGEICDEGTDACIECQNNGDCDDGYYCNGAEVCAAGQCQAGSRPCIDAEFCDETTNTCQLLLQPRTGDAMLGLTAAEQARFDSGSTRFNSIISTAMGLGPIFNQRSCASCHSAGGAGGSGSISVTRFGREDKGGFDPLESLGGSLLQSQANSDECLETIPVEANVMTFRQTNSLFGAGLVEQVPDAKLLEAVNNPPASVSGRAHFVPAVEDPPASPLRVGRFGWKAQVATVLTFSADASLNEMGLTNRFFTQENAPNGNLALLAQCDTVADPEDGPDGEGLHFIDRVADFQRFLAQPPQTPKSGMSGETIFQNIGCAQCHIASFVTGIAPELARSNRVIKPYSDFLLHDMGPLGDGIVQGDATATEVRTPSLWGLRWRDPLLHDGRASGAFDVRVTAAIAEHDGVGSEGQASAVAFAALSAADKARVIAFLDSLGRAEFDTDGDDDVDLADFNAYRVCYDGAGPYNADHVCAIGDIDQDGDTDLDDFDYFLLAYDLPLEDCNNNLIVDLREVLTGAEADVNLDGVPDSCVACVTAVNCNDGDVCTCDRCTTGSCTFTASVFGNTNCAGAVNIDDILCSLAGFQNYASCPNADIAGCARNGTVNLDDILAVLGAFGGANPCGCAP